MEYESKDFYISSCLLAAGLKLLRLEKTSGQFVKFVFSDPNNSAPKILKNHWDRKLKINSRDIIESINELKTRLHNGI